MNFRYLSIQNFASYKDLFFNFDKNGLILIQGATGSGKSTLCDAVSWMLFGRTAKGGAVDEVINWETKDVIKGIICTDFMTITRIRGPKSKDNDLFYEKDGVEFRGKDITDTQIQICGLLGISYDLYMAGAYFHEFSQTAQFFTTSAKNRRVICEQLVDLSLANELTLSALEKIKDNTVEKNSALKEIDIMKAGIQLLERIQVSEKAKADTWQLQLNRDKEILTGRYLDFENKRERVISNECASCGTVLEKPKKIIDASENPYTSRLAELDSKVNPHDAGVKDYSQDIKYKEDSLSLLKNLVASIDAEVSDLTLIKEVATIYRSTCITNAIHNIEEYSNKLLTDNFDAEILIELIPAEDQDRIELGIKKDGNNCSYTQLSKGQRCLLKLCFGIAVMKAVSDHSGVRFNQVFFDEALDGLDENMKTKSFRLLETVAHDYDSVFVVEHSEALKPLFETSYTVTAANGASSIGED